MTIDVILEEPRWADHDLEALCNRAAEAVFAHMALDEDFEVVVMGCADARIAELNTEFRGKPTPTNVLSWPSEERGAEPGQHPEPPEADPMAMELGDIAIALETCEREASEADKPVADHTTHLIVHGLLHLLGYDHIDDKDAALMEGLEIEILGKLGLADPYGRAQA